MFLLFCPTALSGCKVHELGAQISETQAAHVDGSWVKAAKGCWPMLADKSDTYVSVNLADPIGFRNTFPAYASLSDAQLEKIAGEPIDAAPAADINLFRNSSTPLMTRQQATGQAASNSDQRDAESISPMTICAIHSATPAGYR
jgi:hypothetical protein